MEKEGFENLNIDQSLVVCFQTTLSLTHNPGGIMIASPCRNCPKLNMPKTDCAKDCNLLVAIQNFQVGAQEICISSRQDYYTEIGYDISQLFETDETFTEIT